LGHLWEKPIRIWVRLFEFKKLMSMSAGHPWVHSCSALSHALMLDSADLLKGKDDGIQLAGQYVGVRNMVINYPFTFISTSTFI